MFTIDLTPLKPGQHLLSADLAAADLDLDPAKFASVAVDLRLDYGQDRLVVDFEASAVVRLECDRTLAPYDETIAGEHTVVFLAGAEAPPTIGAGGDEDVRPLPEPGQPIDLTDPIRDTLLLALPTRRVAPGAEARDIPLVFGQAQGRTDPRWDALHRLREES